jgi:energy-coupling factor transporter ATP-binding protein EcfA2
MTLFIACHDYEKVLGLTNRVLVLREGRLCADSPPEDVLCRLSSFGLTPPDYYAAEGPGLPGADFFSWIK